MAPNVFFHANSVRSETPFVINQGDLNFYFDDKFIWLKNEIHNFQKLENNWDGYNAIPVKEEAGSIAGKFISLLDSYLVDKISDIFPNPHGTITIEWESPNNEKLSMEIGQNNYSYFVTQKNRQPILANGENPFVDLKKITEALHTLLR
jgi:hypothetical protein